MLTNHVPKHFWGEAVLTATYLINRMPFRVLNFQTPYQFLLKTYPHIRVMSNIHLKVFGCTTFVHITLQNRSKLDPKSTKCIFLGYSSNQSGYKCYFPSTKKIYNSMNVIFFEDQPFYPKINIQGENQEEYRVLSIFDQSSSLPSPISYPDHVPSLNLSANCSQVPGPILS